MSHRQHRTAYLASPNSSMNSASGLPERQRDWNVSGTVLSSVTLVKLPGCVFRIAYEPGHYINTVDLAKMHAGGVPWQC